MAKHKNTRPIQPAAYNMLTYGHQNNSTNSGKSRFDQNRDGSAPQESSSDNPNWGSAEGDNAAYERLDNKLRDFIYGISRGYSVRHACAMSGNDYEVMLDLLNNNSPYFKPELFKLVKKARAVNYARHVEVLNSATDWHAHAFWLERREPREFARAGASLEEEQTQRKALIRMTPETLEALSAAYDAEHGSPSEERE